MKIEITQTEGHLSFEAQNERGSKVVIDGGSPEGFRPMQMVLAAMGTCSAFDIVEILKKQRQEVNSFQITVEGERAKDVTPAPFTHIHLIFHLKGKIDPAKAEKAVALGVEKYCSVGAMLEKAAKITYAVEITP